MADAFVPMLRARSPTWRSEFTRTRMGKKSRGQKNHANIGITDYERNRVLDGTYTAFSVSMLEDGNGTVQQEVDGRGYVLEGAIRSNEREMIGCRMASRESVIAGGA